MKLEKTLLLIALLGIWSCESSEPPLLPDPVDENLIRLNEVLSGPLLTPIGKLKSELFYYGPETLQTQTDYYYDDQGREIIRVGIKDRDTLSISLNEYLQNGNLDRTSVFNVLDNRLFFDYDFQYFYENQGQTVHIRRGRTGTYKDYARYTYDEQGRLSTYRRGDEVNFDLHEYFYPNKESMLIAEEHYRQSGMELPFYIYRYDYDQRNLLQAKSLRLLGPDFRPAFEYYYNAEGQLIEEITNYLYLGTQPIERKTYSYY